ncbi:hypothetical protein CASFOL_024866 [Castilleja foliolosa]|uniref:Probable purine permease n=1 Tax=Castilleja foliolosa TaxID=1961234 RepID=A0ABD3CQZ2_9LAMI
MNSKILFLCLNAFILAVGNCGGPLLTRLYFIHGGKRIWFSSWLQTAAWPIILIPLLISYIRRRRKSASATLFLMKPQFLAAAAGIGTLTGISNYLYSAGFARLPVSTSSLILASQLAFMSVFAFFLVKQKFTAFKVNAVVLLTLGSVILGCNMSNDRPEGESNKDYAVGFVMMIGTAVVFSLALPLMELTYKKLGKMALTYTMVLEMELMVSFVATAFCTVGMVINNDFQAIAGEAKAYALGETIYYVVIVWSAIFFEGFFLGSAGVIFYSSSLLTGVIFTSLLPVTELLAVIFYHERFHAEKGISLFLSLWGFISYFYGEIKHKQNHSLDEENNMDQLALPNTDVP